MSGCPYHDPFKEARERCPTLVTEFGGDPVTMILGFKEVRKAARDYISFSSDAPFRVPIPSEEDVRSVRQLPIEVDPPQHSDYRAIVEPFFKRPLEKNYIRKVEDLVAGLLEAMGERNCIEVVREFALPLQSRALTYLLNVPESEAQVWIDWGVHVFRDPVTGDGRKKGAAMEAYCNRLFDQAERNPGEDFFSALVKARFRGRPLTREEMLGFANLAFAGGRDTIITTVSTIIAYVAENPECLRALEKDPKLIITGAEELIRYSTPLTHIGRVCQADKDVHGSHVEAGNQVSLCWASANFDASVFEVPETVKLDRKPNPHIAFGSGPHTCLGANHARLLVRTLLKIFARNVHKIELLEAIRKTEAEKDYKRHNGFESLNVRVVLKDRPRQPKTPTRS
jgi:cytochrome P450